MSVAERTRNAVCANPFLHDALAAGVVNYTAAARYLDVGKEEAVVAALRRYAEGLTAEQPAAQAQVRVESGLGPNEGEPLLQVGETGFTPGEGSLTGVLATGSLSLAAFRQLLGRCDTADLTVHAAGFTGDAAIVVVERRDGPETLQLAESVCDGS